MPLRAILSDIEGTTSSIAFVAETLFPYACDRIDTYLAAHPAETAAIVSAVETVPGESVADTLRRWIDEDRKAPPLKALQGLIWADGYRSGALHGHVYPDAVDALRTWHAAGLRLYIFSSGSIAAQKLLFAHSVAGDLTALLSGHFDLSTGPKRDPESYARIAANIGLPPSDILFLSDTPEEIDAARTAGLPARLVDRARGDSLTGIDEA